MFCLNCSYLILTLGQSGNWRKLVPQMGSHLFKFLVSRAEILIKERMEDNYLIKIGILFPCVFVTDFLCCQVLLIGSRDTEPVQRNDHNVTLEQ